MVWTDQLLAGFLDYAADNAPDIGLGEHPAGELVKQWGNLAVLGPVVPVLGEAMHTKFPSGLPDRAAGLLRVDRASNQEAAPAPRFCDYVA